MVKFTKNFRKKMTQAIYKETQNRRKSRGIISFQRKWRAGRANIKPRVNNYKKRPTYNLTSEQKYLALSKKDNLLSHPIQTLAKCYYNCVGISHSTPTGWVREISNLEGIQMIRGTGLTQRIGDKVFLQRTVLSYNIDMDIMPNNAGEAYPICEFRTIVFKCKYNFDTKNISNPFESLFLNETNQKYGSNASGFNGSDAMMQPLNRRLFWVLKDYKYKLSVPAIAQGGGDNAHYSSGWSTKYPSMKNFKFYLPHNRMVQYSQTSGNPTDYDPRWFVITYARSLTKETTASHWEVNTRGATLFKDP